MTITIHKTEIMILKFISNAFDVQFDVRHYSANMLNIVDVE